MNPIIAALILSILTNLSEKEELRYNQEIHLRNIQQLTHGGDNAEAYFAFDVQFVCRCAVASRS